jgi:hypothetical protein
MDQLATMLADAESVQEATATAAKREVFIEISVGVMKEGLGNRELGTERSGLDSG